MNAFKGAAVAAVLLAAGPAVAVPVQWDVASGGNGNWYEIVTKANYDTFVGAVAGAAGMTYMGMTGYLATITSVEEQAFLDALNPDFVTLWLGGSDSAADGNWMWVTGPEAGDGFGYTNWAAGEPNNLGGDESGLLGWWAGGESWNDIADGTFYGIVVEYSAMPATVPVPASALMLMAGLAGLGIAARRSRKA